MCLSGLDPSGGAGLSADIETLLGVGCHCAPVATVLTVQNTCDASESQAVEPGLLLRQARAVLEDMEVKCFKVGVVGGLEGIEAVGTLLKEHPEVPVVLDPVLSAGGGFVFAGDGEVDVVAGAMRDLLLPLCTVVTPNTDELRLLGGGGGGGEWIDERGGERHGEGDEDVYADEAGVLLAAGCRNVLLTGGDAGGHADGRADEEDVVNRLYRAGRPVARFVWPRLQGEYHGSGCTLAAAVAGYLARGFEVYEAAEKAQQFTWEALHRGQRLGGGQCLPDRGQPGIRGR